MSSSAVKLLDTQRISQEGESYSVSPHLSRVSSEDRCRLSWTVQKNGAWSVFLGSPWTWVTGWWIECLDCSLDERSTDEKTKRQSARIIYQWNSVSVPVQMSRAQMRCFNSQVKPTQREVISSPQSLIDEREVPNGPVLLDQLDEKRESDRESFFSQCQSQSVHLSEVELRCELAIPSRSVHPLSVVCLDAGWKREQRDSINAYRRHWKSQSVISHSTAVQMSSQRMCSVGMSI